MNDQSWEDAYLAFQSPDEERRKFVRRLRRLGVTPAVRAIELFCGRGNGIAALREIGSANVYGIDFSLRLCHEAPRGFVAQGDCRSLPLRSRCVDLVTVQGGLHHLPALQDELRAVMSEIARVLAADGLVAIVEPWDTPFLRFAHKLSSVRVLRRASRKVDAFATMVELEADVYRTWLANSAMVTAELDRAFRIRHVERRFGKILFAGEPR